ncbi:acyl-CoA dehydrogenase family protein [Parafrankia colletiae]|uniref:acyl-CoA dehydrogenase family protein n=1 Tax=Parafrankia colletiae TaxID=573497 RepID=UPI001F521C19|nr:acyl-CoA dehydrogenase family protein [Parafrankia colletiae]
MPSAPAADWREGWRALAELGVTGFCVPEEKGGIGLRADAAVAVATELGAALHGSPYAGLAASARVLALADDPVADQVLSGVLSGERVCGFGRLSGDGRVARLVDGVAHSDALVLLEQDGDGATLLLDPLDWSADARHHGFDVSRTCADVTVVPGQGRRLVVPAVAVAVDLYELLLAADTVGSAHRMLERTVTYAGQRRSFGRPIGGFQAVQHRLVDHSVRVRGMTLVVTEAARLLSAGSSRARRWVAVAGSSTGAGAPHILHDLLQLSGAIGFTWEYGLHFHQRRVHQNARLAANPRGALRALADLEGWTDAR